MNMNTNNHIHLNPKFLNKDAPNIFVNPKCMRKVNGANSIKELRKNNSLPLTLDNQLNPSTLPQKCANAVKATFYEQLKIDVANKAVLNNNNGENKVLKYDKSRFKLNRVSNKGTGIKNVKEMIKEEICEKNRECVVQKPSFDYHNLNLCKKVNNYKLINVPKSSPKRKIFQNKPNSQSQYSWKSNNHIEKSKNLKLDNITVPRSPTNTQFVKKKLLPKLITTKPINVNRNVFSKTATHTPQHFRKQHIKRFSKYKITRETIKPYRMVYKNSNFITNSSQKKLQTGNNQALKKLRVINIDGKLYSSNDTSLKRRSYVFNNLVTNKQRTSPSGNLVFKKNNDILKSPLKPGTLIEIMRKRKMVLRTKRNEQCTFFQKNGFCKRRMCPFLHKAENVTICTRFLRGDCQIEKCKFSHRYDKNKMPVCCHFVKGSCTRPSCPYRHVKVNPLAPVCKNFLSGNCTDGEDCREQHIFVCVQYEIYGHCNMGTRCQLSHRNKFKTKSLKKSKVTTSSVSIRATSQVLGGKAKKKIPVTRKVNCPRYFDKSKFGESSPKSMENDPKITQLKNKSSKLKLPDQLPAYIPLLDKSNNSEILPIPY